MSPAAEQVLQGAIALTEGEQRALVEDLLAALDRRGRPPKPQARLMGRPPTQR